MILGGRDISGHGDDDALLTFDKLHWVSNKFERLDDVDVVANEAADTLGRMRRMAAVVVAPNIMVDL